MMLKLKTLAIGGGLLAMTACAPNSSWYKEAGAQIDEGAFGNPTMQNMLAQMCYGKGKGHIVPDAVVALDPKSPAGAPRHIRGKVMCSGHLHGKYAQVVFQEYVDSATAPTTLAGGGLQAIEAAGGDE